MRYFILSLFFFFCLPAFAAPAGESPSGKIKHVVYITLDGTRWQDIYLTHVPLKKFWKKYSMTAKFYGKPGSRDTMEVASIPISLPSYQSQMAGSVQPCRGNSCGRIQVETLAENLINKMGLKKKDVVTISSWDAISLAVEHVEGTTLTNTGNFPMYDPDTHVADSVMNDINMRQANDHNGEVRYDKYTIEQALHYFETYQPKFMWISLNDADEAAHNGDAAEYYETLALYDNALDALLTKINQLHLSEETMIIVTTDHGRGDGSHWTDHGSTYPESKRTWAIVINGDLTPMGKDGEITRYNTMSIRPTVENIFSS